ncbi:Hypothetical protein FKW44_022112 [Caligus rogercresseyi]|uniref:Uncharacterized protein n=1 Tax=Caligus rogercresseyi TaxID=217165 RepID=A0A7T8JWC6_CALRO|nr:Hypothetical protein FKW44_022112 [Caligus rogercresseyi]
MKAPEYSTRDHLRVHLTLKNRFDVSLFPSSTSRSTAPPSHLTWYTTVVSTLRHAKLNVYH